MGRDGWRCVAWRRRETRWEGGRVRRYARFCRGEGGVS